jgi:hypothetical protein
MMYRITFIKEGEKNYFWEVLVLNTIILDLVKAKLEKGYYCKIEKL